MENWKKIRNKRGFTLAEVVTAVGIMVIIVGFTGVIFKSGIEAYRVAGANAEIIQKLQTITTQLDRDFSQLRKDGRLVISYEPPKSRIESDKTGSQTRTVRMDRIYYFTTGDFQSYSYPGIRNNVARIFFGHDSNSLSNNNVTLDKCRLARDVMIFTPESPTLDDMIGGGISYGAFSADPNDLNILISSVDASIISNTNNARRVFADNVGEFRIEWTFGEKKPDDPLKNTLIWYSQSNNWLPSSLWPKALKFTFTLYDSKEILKGGRIFTHIVYLD